MNEAEASALVDLVVKGLQSQESHQFGEGASSIITKVSEIGFELQEIRGL